MNESLRILFISAELSPLMSTGGLAEVAAALPRALKAQGHDVRVAIPQWPSVSAEIRGSKVATCIAEMGDHTQYGALWEGRIPGTDLPLYTVQHDGFFQRATPYGSKEHEFGDNAERFCFFNLAVLDGLPQTGWKPDLVHCHDWHGAAAPIFLKTRFAQHPHWRGVPSLFTIHNIAFQGRYGLDKAGSTGLPEELLHNGTVEYHGDLNLMKGALLLADRISTVSQRYAEEIQTPEYGEGLDGALRSRAKDLSGILNGVDYGVWHPANDTFIPERYDASDLRGKAVCKRALRDHCGLPDAPVPMFGMVSRLYWQKGVDLLAEAVHKLEDLPFQLAILGAGDADMEGRVSDLAERFPSKVSVSLKYDAVLAHLIQAGADFFLMPSRYEPCGLSQMYSLAYGALPIVRRTGGLADSIHDLNPVNEKYGRANGISFVPKTVQAVERAMVRATKLYADAPAFSALQQRGMAQDFSWTRSSAAYELLYRDAIRQAAAA
ncbi:MAG: glycogen synthase GlgA [Candidatus Hydrogenedens sp.]|nr:glycogen synthase GlgA [Candidatus Hydrogenedens sp.]